MVFAVRGKTETFDAAVESLTRRYDPLKIFHFQEFLEKSETNTYRSTYEQQVEEVIRFYESLEPSREINFDASLFAGRIERQVVDVEKTFKHRKNETKIQKSVTKTRNVQKKQNVPKLVCHKKGAGAAIGAAICGTLGFFGGGPAGAAALGAACTKVGDEVEPESCTYMDNYVIVTVQEDYSVKVPYQRIIQFHDHFERTIHEEYKVLAGGIKIYVKKNTGEWQLTNSEIIEKNEYEL